MWVEKWGGFIQGHSTFKKIELGVVRNSQLTEKLKKPSGFRGSKKSLSLKFSSELNISEPTFGHKTKGI